MNRGCVYNIIEACEALNGVLMCLRHVAAAQGVRQDEGGSRGMLYNYGEVLKGSNEPQLPGAGRKDIISSAARVEGIDGGGVVSGEEDPV